MQGLTPTLTRDDAAVSPVIGVILMVTISVMLAAVIGFMVTSQPVASVAPTADVEVADADFAYNESAASDASVFVIEHQTGDEIPATEIRLVIRNPDTGSVVASWPEVIDGRTALGDLTVREGGEAVEAGDSLAAGDVWTVVEGSVNATGSANALADDTAYRVEVVHAPSEALVAEQTITLR